MNFNKLKNNWEGFAQSDPMWSILTNPDYKNNQWDKKLFYNSGEFQVAEWLKNFPELQELNGDKALDFGCGMGRLTQALSNHFNEVVGVDVSKTMINLANENNQFPGKCSYELNEQSNLKNLKSNSFDFIISYITLQHIPKKYILKYIDEFIRIIKPGGVILFSLPYKPPLYYRISVSLFSQYFINKYRQIVYKSKYVMEMHWIGKKKLSNFINTKAKLIQTYPDKSAGEKWKGLVYIVTK